MVLLQVGGALASLAYTFLMVRLLTPEQFGATSSVLALAMLLVPLATLNLAGVAIRAIVKARHADDDALAAGFILFARRTVLFMAPVVIAAFLALVWIKFPDIPSTAPVGLGLTALSIVGLSFLQIGAATGVSLDRAVRAQVPRLLVRPVTLLAALALIAAVRWPFGLNGALTLAAAAVFVALVVQRYLLAEAMAFFRETKPRIENPWHWVSTGVFLLPTRIVNEHSKSLMIVVASAFLPLEDVAVISIALSISGLFDFAIVSVEMSFSARLSRALHAGERARATRFLAAAGAAKLALSLVMVLVILFLLEPVLRYFGEHYSGAKAITLILILVPILKSFFGNANLVLLVNDLRGWIFWLQLATMFILPLGALATTALPDVDAMRVIAGGFVVAFVFGFAGLWWIALRKTGVDTSAPGAFLAWMKDRRAG